MTVLASRAVILRVHLSICFTDIIRPNERVRERALHGGKLTQPRRLGAAISNLRGY